MVVRGGGRGSPMFPMFPMGVIGGPRMPMPVPMPMPGMPGGGTNPGIPGMPGGIPPGGILGGY
jgi:hypothetical protein